MKRFANDRPPSPLQPKILCIGEVLWDIFPAGRFLGGAPFNVTCHLHALGCNAALASRVGNDELGREILNECARRGIHTGFIQIDNTLPTGRVNVTLANAHAPRYEILAPAAWDAIEAEYCIAEGGSVYNRRRPRAWWCSAVWRNATRVRARPFDFCRRPKRCASST